MKFFLFISILLSTIFSIQAVSVKLPSAEVLTYRLLSGTNNKNHITAQEKSLRYYFAYKTNLAYKLAYNSLEVKEIIDITWRTIKKIKDPDMQKQALNKMGAILRILLKGSYEGLQEMLSIENNLNKEYEQKNEIKETGLIKKTKLSKKPCCCICV